MTSLRPSTIALVVLCRDEENTLPALLESAQPICDRYVIVDVICIGSGGQGGGGAGECRVWYS